MKILLLANEPPEDFALREDKDRFDGYMGEWYAFSGALSEAVGGNEGAALQGPETATVVSVRKGVRSVEDGPYPDAKEQLGGFFLIEAPDMDFAVAWARKCPAAKTGYVDVVPVPDLAGPDGEEETAS